MKPFILWSNPEVVLDRSGGLPVSRLLHFKSSRISGSLQTDLYTGLLPRRGLDSCNFGVVVLCHACFKRFAMLRAYALGTLQVSSAKVEAAG